MEKIRLGYIDVLRGIAILFIVFGHIPMYCYGLSESEAFPSFRLFTSMVQLPLFFFISGFLFSVKTLFNKSGGGKIRICFEKSQAVACAGNCFRQHFPVIERWYGCGMSD